MNGGFRLIGRGQRFDMNFEWPSQGNKNPLARFACYKADFAGLKIEVRPC